MVRRGSSPKAATPTQTYPRIGHQGKGCQRSAETGKTEAEELCPGPLCAYGPGIGASVTHAAILMASMLALVLSLHARFHPLACHLE